MLGGVLFIAGTLYIGLSAPGAALYISCGLVSIVYGAYIFVKRHQYRNLTKTGQIDISTLRPQGE